MHLSGCDLDYDKIIGLLGNIEDNSVNSLSYKSNFKVNKSNSILRLDDNFNNCKNKPLRLCNLLVLNLGSNPRIDTNGYIKIREAIEPSIE